MNILYLLFIAPLEFLMRLVLEWGYSMTHSWGVALVFLSLLVNTLVLPIYNRAEGWQEEERELKRRMSRHESMFRRRCTGWERFAMLSALRRLHGCDWRITLRASVGLLLQIPFFFAAFHLLSHYTALNGQSLGPLADLGAPDALLSFGGVSVNALPIAMTAVNLFSAFFYTRDLTRRDKAQIYGMAAIFLGLLYNAASALTLYWTLNNVYSLGKNIVEKDLMRRPTWQSFQNRYRQRVAESFAGLHGGRLLQTVTRFMAAIRRVILPGGVFCILTCLCRLFAHEYNINSADKTNLQIFLYQCFLTIVLASLTFYFIHIPRYGSKLSSNNKLLFFITIGLFIFQADLFHFGTLLITSNYIYFDMWGTRGIVLFLIWFFSVIIIDKFYDELKFLYNRLRVIAIRCCYNPLKNSFLCIDTVTHTENKHDSIFWGVTMSIITALFTCYYIPFLTYFNNINEFTFNGFMLFFESSKWVVPCASVSLLLFILSRFFFSNQEYIKLPWKLEYNTGGSVNLFYIFILIVFFMLAFEGSIFSYNLPRLDGDDDIFRSPARLVIDSLLWIIVLVLGIKYWQYFAKRLYFFIFLLILFVISTLCDAYSVSEEKNKIQTFKSNNHLFMVDRDTLYSRLCFSSSENIIILLVDSLDTLAFEKMLELYPENKKIFDGFWLFRENLGAGGITDNAVPAILLGDVQRREDKNFHIKSLVGSKSISALAYSFGRKVFIDAGRLGHVISDENNIQIENYTAPEYIDLKEYSIKFLFRFFPYFFKRLYLNTVNFQDDNLRLVGVDRDTQTFRQIFAGMDCIEKEPVLHFYYFFGTHLPFLVEDIFQTADKFFKSFEKFINILKHNNIYNNTTIIIISDHGLAHAKHDHRFLYPERNLPYSTFIFPLFMVKTPDSSKDISIHDDLMSSLYLKEMLKFFYLHGPSMNSLQLFLDSLPDQRLFYYTGEGNELYRNPVIMKATGRLNNLKFEPVQE